jgi:predicted deacylase
MMKETAFLESYQTAVRKVSFPILRICGTKPGPRLTLVAGMNSSEYVGTLVCLQIYKRLIPHELSGQLKMIPIANPQGFDLRRRYTVPIENDFNGEANLNRLFRNTEKERSSPRLLANSIFSEVLDSDYLIDIHGGDEYEDITPSVMYTLVAARNPRSRLRRVDDISRKLAESTQLDWIIEGLCDLSIRGRIHVEACFNGIPSINIEVGNSGILEERYVQTLNFALDNVLFWLGMISEQHKTVAIKHQQIKYITDLRQVRSTKGGLLKTLHNVGDVISKGEPLGEILGLDGKVREWIYSDIDGVLVEQRTNPVVYSGDLVFEVGIFELRKALNLS